MLRLEHEVSLAKRMHNFIEMEWFSPYEKKPFSHIAVLSNGDKRLHCS